MVPAGFFTTHQYKMGYTELEECVISYYKNQDSKPISLNVPTASNKYDDIEEDVDNSPFVKDAQDELKLFMQYNMVKFLPTINNPTIPLVTMDKNGNPQDHIITIVPVSKIGMNLPYGKNHADYIDKHGYYEIFKILEDHKEIFPGIDNVGVGQHGLYISTEVYCEILFNQYGYISQPRRANTKTRIFVRLVNSKNCLQRIFCDPKKVEKLCMKCHANNEWDHNGERDDKTFLQVEKEIYIEMFPHNKAVFGVDEED